MSEPSKGLPAEERLFESSQAAIDELQSIRIEAMRRLVRMMSANSTAEALNALRESFPDTPFQQRVAVLSGRR